MRTIRVTFRRTATVALSLATAMLAMAGGGSSPAVAADRGPAECGAGRLCLWGEQEFQGAQWTYELSTIDIESCVALPSAAVAESFAQRIGRPVTTYQSAHCDTTGEFSTYPSGTWVPESPYAVRAFTVWER